MLRKLSVLLITPVLMGALLVAGVEPSGAQTVDRDCADFATQAAAQRFFVHHNPSADPHYLDADSDGIACEDNPCPCSTSGGGGGGGGGHGHHAPKPPEVKKTWARIVEVIDGDTVRVRIKRHQADVRLVGIDTPESYGGRECGSRQASAAARKQLPRGARVKLISDPTQDLKDRYGRQLRYVERHGRDVNKFQVRHGWAKVYVYDHNPFQRTRAYKHAKELAKRQDLGVWDRCGGRFHRPA